MNSYKQKKLIEKLADIEHQRWADWQQYLFSKCSLAENECDLVIPIELVKRWQKQIETDYKNLSEKEKDSDREQVMRYWPIISSLIDETEKQAYEEGLNLRKAYNDPELIEQIKKQAQSELLKKMLKRSNTEGARFVIEDELSKLK